MSLDLAERSADLDPAGGDGVQLSLLTPSGRLTVGNYLGALRPMREATGRCFFGISDLHAMTTTHRPDLLRARIAEFSRLMIAVGLDPDRQVIFRQSAVPEHTGLHYLLECVARVGELGRMIQYKEKGRGRPDTRMSLLSYPVLMAADILLYQAEKIPVGDDQTQHVELARDLAQRFNRDYPGSDGDVFTVPEVINPKIAARLKDLQDPAVKMSKSSTNPAGVIYLLDSPETIRRKIKRAVTDSEPGISYRPDERPGLANLLDLGAATSGLTVQELINSHTSFGTLKNTVADAVIAIIEPIRTRYAEIDPAEVRMIFARGAEQARAAAAPTLAAARDAIGLG
ncbi:tryptophan--tRNA ligase [Microlunatus elymi]|uniref:Tryptophan--tRNA ligase n=1 Tax=Microlunatus elymi TaxID=2596828 RepID=A0A516Q1U4_9ACTN|nr:tryptophan--tRNA ligase [Microlunatus elymi]QDP97409.1 tryptophan--tRNA ligase [Microlunatus elymi]